jgi:thiol-disulfide isomerase/thioredoxin
MGPENSPSFSLTPECASERASDSARNSSIEVSGEVSGTLFTCADLRTAEFDHRILSPSERLRVVFFRGANCPNCSEAENQLAALAAELKNLPIEFYAVDAYANLELVTRFGLYGIPAFLSFKRGRLIGRMNSFPTRAEFLAALRRQL